MYLTKNFNLKYFFKIHSNGLGDKNVITLSDPEFCRLFKTIETGSSSKTTDEITIIQMLDKIKLEFGLNSEEVGTEVVRQASIQMGLTVEGSFKEKVKKCYDELK